MGRILFFGCIILFQTISMAQTCCICETGQKPVKEVGFYIRGCKVWLGQQTNCNSKVIVSRPEDLREQANFCAGGLAKIGYVGHWENTTDTITMIQKYLLPLMTETRASVEYSNTACSPTSDPDALEKYVRSLPISPPQYFRVVGSQVPSMGMWETFLPFKASVFASVDTRELGVRYSSCKGILDRNCIQQVQLDSVARCVRKDGELITVQCKEMPQSYSGDIEPRSLFQWTRIK